MKGVLIKIIDEEGSWEILDTVILREDVYQGGFSPHDRGEYITSISTSHYLVRHTDKKSELKLILPTKIESIFN